MPGFWIAYDPTAPAGQRLPPEVIEEIILVAPSQVTNGSIKTQHLAPDAVTQDKIAPGAVGTTEIATNGVRAVNIQSQAVTTDKLADGSVTPVKTGVGVVDVTDSGNNPVTANIKYVTAAEFAAITTPDPNIEYHISG